MTLPLEGIRVLDLTRLLPGPFATLVMADLGADVLKVEEPGKGDYVRWMPPFRDDRSAGLVSLNRNKRSMTLNLKSAEGREVFLRLARDADVVIESFRPGVMDRLGIGYDALSKVNDKIVYCAITGYGQDGPYKDKAGHDINYLGYAGVLGVIGPAGGDPVIPGVQIGDIGGGALMALGGVLAALIERGRTGRGRFVDISMTDGSFAWLAMHMQAYLYGEPEPARGEMRLSGSMACYNVYRCADGHHVTVGALEPQFWAALCNALEVPELIADHLGPQDVQDRMKERLAEIFASKPRDEWVAVLGDLDACVGPVNSFAEAAADPQLRARDMISGDGPEAMIGNPVRLDGATPQRRAAPGFGEHTDAVLADAGYDAAAIAALRSAGAI